MFACVFGEPAAFFSKALGPTSHCSLTHVLPSFPPSRLSFVIGLIFGTIIYCRVVMALIFEFGLVYVQTARTTPDSSSRLLRQTSFSCSSSQRWHTRARYWRHHLACRMRARDSIFMRNPMVTGALLIFMTLILYQFINSSIIIQTRSYVETSIFSKKKRLEISYDKRLTAPATTYFSNLFYMEVCNTFMCYITY